MGHYAEAGHLRVRPEEGVVNRRSWFAVEGSLEPIDYDGPSFFRFPEAVAEHVIERYSAPGDWIIDPFCGFGTTLVVAERLGRHAVGCEADERRAAFSASRLRHPDRVVHGRCEDLTARSVLVSQGEFYGRRFATGVVCPAMRVSAVRFTG